MQTETHLQVGLKVAVETVSSKSKPKLLDKFLGSTRSINFHTHILRGSALHTMVLWVFISSTVMGLLGGFGGPCYLKLQGDCVCFRMLNLTKFSNLEYRGRKFFPKVKTNLLYQTVYKSKRPLYKEHPP
jgi:hypothetical protein